MIRSYRTSHNCDLAREVEGLHNMLVWGLCEDHDVVLAVARTRDNSMKTIKYFTENGEAESDMSLLIP